MVLIAVTTWTSVSGVATHASLVTLFKADAQAAKHFQMALRSSWIRTPAFQSVQFQRSQTAPTSVSSVIRCASAARLPQTFVTLVAQTPASPTWLRVASALNSAWRVHSLTHPTTNALIVKATVRRATQQSRASVASRATSSSRVSVWAIVPATLFSSIQLKFLSASSANHLVHPARMKLQNAQVASRAPFCIRMSALRNAHQRSFPMKRMSVIKRASQYSLLSHSRCLCLPWRLYS